MFHAMMRKVMWASVVVAAAAALVGTNSIGQEAKEKKAKGKLPAYYADVVTETQRQKIYAIQDKYAKQISDLQAQLNAITTQRDMEIETLLSAEQKEKVKKARDEAAAKKKQTAEEKKAAADADKAK